MMKFDLNLLPIAVALYDERSVSKAAQRLGMSQSAVSMALRKLRETFNDQLFIRAPNGVTPTPRAHALIETARPLVAATREGLLLTEDRFDPQATTRAFTFALSDVGEMVFLPKLLERLHREAPNAQVRSCSMRPAQISEGLESGEIDLAVGYFPDLAGQNFFRQRLFTHHFACLVRSGHPVRKKPLTLDAFLAMEHAVVHAEGRSQEIVERFLDRRKIHLRVALTTPHFLSLPMVIARSDLITTVPHAVALYFTRLSAQLAIVKPPFDIAGFDLRQHWHRKFNNDARSRWLRKEVSELFNDQTDEWKADWIGKT